MQFYYSKFYILIYSFWAYKIRFFPLCWTALFLIYRRGYAKTFWQPAWLFPSRILTNRGFARQSISSSRLKQWAVVKLSSRGKKTETEKRRWQWSRHRGRRGGTKERKKETSHVIIGETNVPPRAVASLYIGAKRGSRAYKSGMTGKRRGTRQR